MKSQTHTPRYRLPFCVTPPQVMVHPIIPDSMLITRRVDGWNLTCPQASRAFEIRNNGAKDFPWRLEEFRIPPNYPQQRLSEGCITHHVDAIDAMNLAFDRCKSIIRGDQPA
jgi:hypothetical protein